ncbi:hypothetical protein AVEN_223781-1 [Araneus ventricosus]|uniref:Uncharacterized protein n=1 Tax=Araneus ventricosus TaxID=182803 RepID=A0A4Y2DKA1_ARAVE|nr:hypothetical protein AVEN_223781-1 [Araneus ventricosus]
MRRSRSCNVGGGVAYTCCLRYHHRKKSIGVRSGERGGHSWKPPYPIICSPNSSTRKGVDGFSVETPALLTDPVPISQSSDSLTDAWAITKFFLDYVMHSSFAYRQFNSNLKCGDPTILTYELIHSRDRGTVGHNVRLPRAWQVLDVYGSHLITLTPPE